MADVILERLRAIVRSLPETGEKTPWGPDPHWTVRDKIFAGYSDGVLGIRVDKDLQAMLIASDPRFSIAPYVGKYGGVSMQLGAKPDWREIEALMVGSYRIMAPKTLAAQVGGAEATPAAPPPRVKTPAKKAARRAPAKKAARKTPP
ncbi:MAG: MmcQ/YjbR family DNA-binding protein [Kofleriaceae bacterium]|nr:MmcQ/YjbR family DNA-binding protein [Myxococcales bacterium]MCB9561635.1 MmcQ/YjbR family DNA-binding protein [Kofleriaceae bacterium]